MAGPLTIGVVFIVGAAGAFGLDGAEVDVRDSTARQPVAMAVVEGRVFVANSRTGTVSVIDAQNLSVDSEHRIADSLSNLERWPGTLKLLALDDAAHRLLAVDSRDVAFKPTVVTSLPRYPVRIAVSSSGRIVCVSSLWSRQISIIVLNPESNTVTKNRAVSVEFAPREQLLFSGDSKLLVTDAFGGRFAIIDVDSAKVERIGNLPAHNIRGLALSDDEQSVFISHQYLNPLARTDFDDVHWGMLMTNAVRRVPIASLLNPETKPHAGSRLIRLGVTGEAAADPGAVSVAKGDFLTVLFSGTNQIGFTLGPTLVRRESTGRRPIAFNRTAGRIFVANSLDDSVTVLNPTEGGSASTIPLGSVRELSSPERGEQLFYDAGLSHDGWMSCHSCHSDGHSSGLVADTLGDGDFGAPKRIPSLLGTAGTGPWAWNGSMQSLDDQIRKSVKTTMHGEALSDTQAADLSAYLATLAPAPIRSVSDRQLVERGRLVFEERRCVRCHHGNAFTTRGIFDVGLVDEANRRKFNPPSLRGVGQRDALFHDGRARSLEEAVGSLRHQLDTELTDADLRALLAFLRSL